MTALTQSHQVLEDENDILEYIKMVFPFCPGGGLAFDKLGRLTSAYYNEVI